MYDFDERNNVYASLAVANREPIRKDFRENTPDNQPKSERLINLESGYRYKGQSLMLNANVYYMHYTDQLVLTGQINDVGDYTRRNVDISYRSGLELEAAYRLSNKLSVTGNTTISSNKIKAFSEYVDNYDNYDENGNMIQDTIKKITKIKPKLSTTGGTSDARFIRKIAPCLEFGLVGKTMHKVGECVSLADLKKLTLIYTKILGNYFKWKLV